MSYAVQLKFNSITELGRAVQDSVEPASDYSDAPDEAEFTRAEAIEMALAGGNWSDGAKDIRKADLSELEIITSEFTSPQWVPDVVGYYPDVPEYLAGVPEDMVNRIDLPEENKVVRMAVAVGRIHGFTVAQTYNRGNAVLSIIDALQLAGFSVELTALWRNEVKKKIISIETVIKNATETWSPASVAFALCSLAFQRRLCWRLAECCEIKDTVSPNGYGNGRNVDYPEFDIAIPYGEYPSDFNSHAGAMRIVMEAVRSQWSNDLAA